MKALGCYFLVKPPGYSNYFPVKAPEYYLLSLMRALGYYFVMKALGYEYLISEILEQGYYFPTQQPDQLSW